MIKFIFAYMNYTELTNKAIEISNQTNEEILSFVELQNNDEFLVDLKMMFDIVNSTDLTLFDLLSLDRDAKRLTILEFIATNAKDKVLFEDISNTITENKLSKLDHIKNVVKNLRAYVGVSDCAVKEFGEVMTPIELVEEMLDTLPAEVWSNPNLKWLDPANGVGIFPCVVVYRLMEGLKEFEPNEDLRYKHIMENMLYVCELQTKNMFIYQTGFDPHDEIELNIHNGSFLDKAFEDKMKIWGVEKFDIVVGNPPYNQMIDMDFLKVSYRISDRILFVHPSTWLLDEKGKQRKFVDTKEMIKKHLERITLFNGNKLFGIALFVPCVITEINKNKTGDKIRCIDRINNVELDYDNINQINKYSNIVEYFSIKEKISKNIESLLSNKNKIKGAYYVNCAQIRGNVYLNSDVNMLKDDFYTIITKDTIVENNKTKHMFFSFDTKNEAEFFIKYLKTNFVRFCLSVLKNNSHLDRGELSLIPYLDFTQEWTDEKLNELFEFTENEISFIKKFIPKYY